MLSNFFLIVAIKKLGKIDDLIDAKRVLREIKIMKNLEHENILGLKDVLYQPKEGYAYLSLYTL